VTITIRTIGRVLCGVVLCAVILTPAPAEAQGARYALLVQGASGEEQYAVLHRRWLDGLAGLLRDRFKYDAAHLIVLAEQPGAGEERATAESVRGAIARVSAAMTPADQLVIVLIGHGSGAGPDAKFNLVGQDLTVAEWAELLKPLPGRLALVNTTSASFPYLAGLAAPGRVVITATNSPAQRFHTVFPDGFVQAFSTDVADLDKNARVSLWEAFVFASRTVKQHYEQNGIMATEFAVLDDSGDGTGRDAAGEGEDGTIAELTYFDAPALPTASDPETQKLLIRQRDLTEQMDDLRRRQASMSAEEYERAFEKLALELAEVSREVRKRTGP
jgi:hypothetical protein